MKIEKFEKADKIVSDIYYLNKVKKQLLSGGYEIIAGSKNDEGKIKKRVQINGFSFDDDEVIYEGVIALINSVTGFVNQQIKDLESELEEL